MNRSPPTRAGGVSSALLINIPSRPHGGCQKRPEMRAVTFSRFGGPEVLEVSELPVPQPGRGEVRIRVASATVNPTDISFRTGRQQTTAQLAEMGVVPPYIPGME